MLTNKGFAFAMALLGANYSRELPEFQQQLFRDHLADLTDEQLVAAVQHAIANSEFMPTVAKLRSFVHGDGKTRAMNALRDVEKLIGSRGGLLEHVDVRTLEPATQKAALEVTLWQIRECTEYNRAQLEQRFEAAYARAEATIHALPSANARVIGRIGSGGA